MRYTVTSRAGWGRRQGCKPPIGSILSPVVACDPAIVLLFNEGGAQIVSASTTVNSALVNYGTAGSVVQPQLNSTSGSSSLTWVNGPGGLGLKSGAVVDQNVVLTPNSGTDGGFGGRLKLDRVTIFVIRSKTDTTKNNCTQFGWRGNLQDTARMTAFAPFTDGNVYFEYGGISGINLLTWAGYTAATNVESWTFRAGKLGMAMWFQGIKVASQATAVTRAAALSANMNFQIFGSSNISSDKETIYFFALCNDELSDAAIQAWYADPYGFFFAGQNQNMHGFKLASGMVPRHR